MFLNKTVIIQKTYKIVLVSTLHDLIEYLAKNNFVCQHFNKYF